jgi:hypothetical protein
MTHFRLLLAHLVILALIGGSFYDILTRQEHWPLSNYPMFSAIHRAPVLRWPRLFGVTEDGREVPLVRHDYLWPLDQSRLPIGLRRTQQMQGGDARLRTALADCLRRYEARRNAGDHDGPPLHAVRLYTVTWDLEPYAANLERPRSRVLVAEATLP